MFSWLPLLLSGTDREAELIHGTAKAILYYVSPILFVLLYYVLPSPYGKLATPRWNQLLGPTIPARLAWFLFELPNLIWATATLWDCYFRRKLETDDSPPGICGLLLFGFFVIHYIRRTLWYPWKMSPSATPSSAGVVLNALAYTIVNGYLQCRSLLCFEHFPSNWVMHPMFWGGLILAIAGMIINAQTDAALRRLRSQRKTGYQIPHGYWLFDYVSCPHYFGEILQWLGFCLACRNSVVAASFLAFTAANLIPRAVQQHTWYQKHFKEAYPQHRKAWLPLLW